MERDHDMVNEQVPAILRQPPTSSSQSSTSTNLELVIQVVLKDFRFGVDAEVFAIEVASYKRVLRGVTPSELLDAWEAHQLDARGYDDRGRLLKPTAIGLRTRVNRARYLAAPLKRIEPPAPRPARTAEEKARADEIVAQVGFTLERRDLLKRFPKCRTDAEIEDAQASVNAGHWTQGLPDDDPRIVALRQGREAYRVQPGEADDA